MTPPITYSQVQRRLAENHLHHEILELQDGAFVVVLERGGRVLGPFLDEEGESIFWMNPVWADADAFTAFIRANEWNVGGDRIWIAPEIQYHVRDRRDFWGTLQLPPAVDPGQYALDRRAPKHIHLSCGITLDAYNLATGRKSLFLDRLVRPAKNPLRHVSAYETLMTDVSYAGYEQTLTITETSTDDIRSEGWNLIQLNPGGDLFIPTCSDVEYNDYYEPIDDTLQTIEPGYVRLQITGQRQYKVGYKAPDVFGRLGYLSRLDNDRWYLIVRNFFNNPSAPYLEEPPHQPGNRGCSIHVYNDGGQFGGFGELECQGQTIGGDTGRKTSVDLFVLWLFVGSEERLKLLARRLLGIALPSSLNPAYS